MVTWWSSLCQPLCQLSRLCHPISKIRMILLMDVKIWMVSLIIIFTVRPIYAQDAIFKMSSTSLGNVYNVIDPMGQFMSKLSLVPKVDELLTSVFLITPKWLVGKQCQPSYMCWDIFQLQWQFVTSPVFHSCDILGSQLTLFASIKQYHMMYGMVITGFNAATSMLVLTHCSLCLFSVSCLE